MARTRHPRYTSRREKLENHGKTFKLLLLLAGLIGALLLLRHFT